MDESRSHSIAVVQSFPACTRAGDAPSVGSKPSSPGGHSPNDTAEEKAEPSSDPSQVKEEVKEEVEPGGRTGSEGGEDALPSAAGEGTSHPVVAAALSKRGGSFSAYII